MVILQAQIPAALDSGLGRRIITIEAGNIKITDAILIPLQKVADPAAAFCSKIIFKTYGGGSMIILIILAALLFIYLGYVLLNPEKF